MSVLLDNLLERRNGLVAQMEAIATAATAEGRALEGDQLASFDRMIAEVDQIDQRAQAIREGEQRAADIQASYESRNPEARGGQPQAEGAFGTWMREARNGDAYDMAPVRGAERRAIASRGRGVEERQMSATNGVAPDGVYGTLWEYAVAGSQVLQAGVDVITTADGNTIPLPVVTAHAQAASGVAGAALNSSDAVLATVNLGAVKYNYYTDIPNELFQDTAFDLEGYVSRAAGRELGRTISAVAAAAVTAGFTVTGATAATATVGATGGVFSDALITLFHSVLPEYRSGAAWLGADPVVAAIRKTKDGSGQYVWTSPLTVGDPDMVIGKPIYVDPNLPSNVGAAAKVLYFGDFSALKVRIAGGLRFERSDQAAWKNDCVSFRAIVRTAAVVVDPNAVKSLALTAS